MARSYSASAQRTEEILRQAKAKAQSLLNKKPPNNLSALERAYLTRLRELSTTNWKLAYLPNEQ